MTKENAKKDIEKISSKFGSFGPGTEADRAAQLFLQSFDVLRRRLGKPAILKMLYLDSPAAAEMLPDAMRDIVRRLCGGELNVEQADRELAELKSHYELIIAEMSITPTKPTVLVSRSGDVVGVPLEKN